MIVLKLLQGKSTSGTPSEWEKLVSPKLKFLHPIIDLRDKFCLFAVFCSEVYE